MKINWSVFRLQIGLTIGLWIGCIAGISACPSCLLAQDHSINNPPPVAHSATLKWAASNQTVNYRIWRSNTQTGTYTKIKDQVTNLTYKDTTVVSGHTYYYKVDCRNPKTNLVSPYSNIAKAVIP